MWIILTCRNLTNAVKMFSLFFTVASSLIWTHLPFAGIEEKTASPTRAGKTFLLPPSFLSSNEAVMSLILHSS